MIHLRRISFEKSQIISLRQEVGEIEFASGGLVQDLLRFGVPILVFVSIGKCAVAEWKIRIQFHRLLGCVDRLRIFSGDGCDLAGQHRAAARNTRIGLDPGCAILLRLLHVPRDLQVVRNRDEKPFRVAGPLAQLISAARVFRGEVSFSQIAIHASEHAISHDELRINLDRPLQERDRSRRARGIMNLLPGAVRLQSFQR